MPEWNQIKLGEIAEFRNGVNFSKDSFGTGIKVINVGDFKDRMYPDYNSLSELDSSKKWHKDCFLEENDIVFVRSNGNKALIGRSIFIKNLPETPVTFSAFSIRLRFKKGIKLDPKFYLYLFKSPLFRALLSLFGNGTNISNLNQDILNNLVVPNPPFEVQSQISSTLSTYDDLIENNNQRIHLLEETAAEIYKEWFIRLRFPGYQDTAFFDKNGKEVSFGTKEALPKNWKKVKIENAFDILGGGTPLTTEPSYWEKGTINWFAPSDITATKNIFLEESPKQITELGLKKSSTKLFPEKCVMMTSRATIGAIGINLKPACVNQGFIVCIPNENFSYPYIFHWIKRNTELFKNFAGGATFLEISRTVFKNLKILKPNLETITKFNKLVIPLFEEHNILSQKNKVLKQTRDLLIPRLISGKLNIEQLTTI